MTQIVFMQKLFGEDELIPAEVTHIGMLATGRGHTQWMCVSFCWLSYAECSSLRP